jgi:hypothetical protein
LDRPELPHITYDITVAGRVPEEMLKTFPGVVADRQRDVTVLRAVLPSREALQSMLAVIDLFELDVIEVKRNPPDEDTSSSDA